MFPSDTTCRPAATQRDGMPPVTERDGIGPTTQRGGMTPAEPAKSQAALQPMHCVRRAGRDGRVAAKVDSQGRKPQGKTYASGFNGTGNRRGSAKPRAGLVPSDATCRPTATQRDGMPPVTERHGMRGTTPCGGMPPGEPAKSARHCSPCIALSLRRTRCDSLRWTQELESRLEWHTKRKALARGSADGAKREAVARAASLARPRLTLRAWCDTAIFT